MRVVAGEIVGQRRCRRLAHAFFFAVFAAAFLADFLAADFFAGLAASAASASLAVRGVGTPVFFSGGTKLPRGRFAGSAAATMVTGCGPAGLLPLRAARALARVEKYGILLMIGLLIALPSLGSLLGKDLNLFSKIILPIVERVVDLIAVVAGLHLS